MFTRLEKPAEVTLAPPAKGKTPDIPGKPGKLRSGLSGTMATGGDVETTQLKNYARGVKESMGVDPLYCYLLIPTGHCPVTDPAIDSFDRAGVILFRFLPNG